MSSMIRPSATSVALIASIMLFALGANAQATFSMTGRAATGSGAFVDLPAFGQPCPSITGRIGFPKATMQPKTVATLIPANFPKGGTQNPGGCIPGGPAKVVTTGMGNFSVPVKFFKQTFPGGSKGGTPMNLLVTPVPNIPKVLQFASSFKFSGPVSTAHTFGPWFEKKNPVLKSKAYAPWRLMKHHTAAQFASQTGRAGGNFTACGGTAKNLACTVPSGGAIPAIVKNIAGPGGFGGTIGLVLTTSPTQLSSLVVKIGAGQTVQINILTGMRSRAAGRGYAAYDTDDLMSGPIFLMYKLTMTMSPQYANVMSVSGFIGSGGKGKNQNWGFPFTTGQVIARGTGATMAGGAPAGQTVTAKGVDKATTMIPGITKAVPGGRLIQLVAGGMAQANIQGPNGTPNYTIVRLPEPSRAIQLFAGAAGLLAIALWRGRKAD